MNESEKRNIRDLLYNMEAHIIKMLHQINTLYGFIGKDVRLSINRDDYGDIKKQDEVIKDKERI